MDRLTWRSDEDVDGHEYPPPPVNSDMPEQNETSCPPFSDNANINYEQDETSEKNSGHDDETAGDPGEQGGRLPDAESFFVQDDTPVAPLGMYPALSEFMGYDEGHNANGPANPDANVSLLRLRRQANSPVDQETLDEVKTMLQSNF